MNTNNIKKYAPKARREFIEAVTKRLNQLGIHTDNKGNLKVSVALVAGDVMQIDGNSFDARLEQPRRRLVERAQQQGFVQLVEHIAYTWFNRLCAIRYMELHDYLEHGFRVLSSSPSKGEGRGEGFLPEILDHAQDVAGDLGLDRNTVVELKLAGNKDEALYRELLLGQCHKLHQAMPFLFEAIDDDTELLLPDNLTRTDSILRGLVNDIPAEDWEQVEVIGWLYQFYISEKKDEVIGKVVKSEDIPAATQLFTPNWIVKYLVQNSVGRQWLQTYPDSSIKAGMDYFIEPAQQTDEVNAQIKAITPDSIEPESIKVLDPACGSGHILVEAYHTLKAIYEERGYRSRDIPQLILENNLFGLDIDDRAAQLAGFALMMLARADDRRIFSRDVRLNVLAMQSTAGFSLQTEECLLIQDEQQRQEFVQNIQNLLALFEQAKTFGSLIEVPEPVASYLPTAETLVKQLAENGDLFAQHTASTLIPLIKQAEILARKYDAVVANPPYMGSKYQTEPVKKYLKDNFKGYEKDLFSAFIVRNLEFAKGNGQLGFMTPFVWMFISSYEQLRGKLVDDEIISTLIQLEYSGFDGATVPICTFTLTKGHIVDYVGSYIKLSDFKGHKNQAPKTLEAIENRDCGWFFDAKPDDFKKIPGSPIAYWVSDNLRNAFVNGLSLGEIGEPRLGMATGNNDLYVRAWQEVSIKNVGFNYKLRADAKKSEKKWFPYNKGGQFRRWYGNNEYIVDWGNDGYSLQNTLHPSGERIWAHNFNLDYIFKPCLTFTATSSSYFGIRYSEVGFLFDNKGSSYFSDPDKLFSILGFLASKPASHILKAINPTIEFQPGNISILPFFEGMVSETIKIRVMQIIQISNQDWDNYEISWDFQNNPLIIGWVSDSATQQIEATNVGLRDKAANPIYPLSDIYAVWQTHNGATILEMQRLEQENNRLFIDAYGLQDELTPDVPLEQITLTVNPKYRYGGNLSYEALESRFQSDTLVELISYAIGCIMGRYSLDQQGLVYAHAGNKGFTELVQQGAYKTFPVDDDGIIPLTEQEWFADDATHRFREFVRVVWGEDTLQQNLDFVAESLCLYAIKAKSGESSLATIRRYLSTQFYKDHLKTYKKRPIYWLFSSGKQKAFECLVYLHRYNESTLSRMRTEYVTPLLGKYDAYAEQLQKQLDDATTTAEANRLKKQRDALTKKQAELRQFDDKLKHYADMRIKLDLDDGVKVNYGKFGDLLFDVKGITGKAPEVI